MNHRNTFYKQPLGWITLFLLSLLAGPALVWSADKPYIPRRQERPPGPAVPSAQACQNMSVPKDFSVEVFADEPNVVNPTAMTFDAQGRLWICESVEYPRSKPGKGKDRIKILQDTDGDGKADQFSIFAEGLNIPCGIALGNGGAYVTNAPDLLFLKDTNGDGKADEKKVLLTGFGRTDTHELPNSLIWGPDGWLYGLNGVFNRCHVKHKGKDFNFTCAVWRYHPKKDDFELFCEGTSNPWGLDYNQRGDFFVSACVIDHFWHLTETGYYHRQAGAYPPYTWKIESIVKHKHQKAAYCGLTRYDGDAYPKEYRGGWLMGNIHGNCLNYDVTERRGASYFARPKPDFLSGNDVWFMPVSQKVGPDGCVWVLDWYDRYHCYQDARRDPKGVDRLKGRVYRVTYKNTPMAKPFNLEKETDAQLIARLGDDNVFFRRLARRLLVERGGNVETLEKIVLNDVASQVSRTEALWTLASMGEFRPAFHQQLLNHDKELFRTWAVRTAGAMGKVDDAVKNKVVELANDSSPEVRLQVAIAARKLQGVQPLDLLMTVLSKAAEDPSGLSARIVWHNMQPLVISNSQQLFAWMEKHPPHQHQAVAEIFERIVDRILADRKKHPEALDQLIGYFQRNYKDLDGKMVGHSLTIYLQAALNNELGEKALKKFGEQFAGPLAEMAKRKSSDPCYKPAMGFSILLGQKGAAKDALEIVASKKANNNTRGLLLECLVKADTPGVVETAVGRLGPDAKESEDFTEQVLIALRHSKHPEIADQLVKNYPSISDHIQAQVIDLLASRPMWAEKLLDAIEKKALKPSDVNVNQVRQILNFKKKELTERVTKVWGRVREGRDPNREKLIQQMSAMLNKQEGNAHAGAAVFKKVCAQCHQIYGEGHKVGPDITSNGRADLKQILSNVFDPNLVIGKDYQARMIATADGRVLRGLPLEDSERRVVLKVAGGKTEVVPRDDIEAMEVSKVSLMPEGLEKQLKPQEIRDLIAYLMWETPPPAPVKPEIKTTGPADQQVLSVKAQPNRLVVLGRASGNSKQNVLAQLEHGFDGRLTLENLRTPKGVRISAQGRNPDARLDGLFVGHGNVSGSNCWAGNGHVRSQGLSQVVVDDQGVTIVGKSNYRTRPKQGQSILDETIIYTVHRPKENYYVMDIKIDWKGTPAAAVNASANAGLGVQVEGHAERKIEQVTAKEAGAQAIDLSGYFDNKMAGVALLAHPSNGGAGPKMGLDRDRRLVVNPFSKGTLHVNGDKPLTLKFRVVVHDGRLSKEELTKLAREYAGGGQANVNNAKRK